MNKNSSMIMHSRHPKTKLLKIDLIKTDPTIIIDKYFVKTYAEFETGKIKCSLTRIRADKIVSGYYTRDSRGFTKHISNLRKDYIDTTVNMIRAGNRPTVDLYWSPHAPSGGGYVCSDDEVVLAAYKILKIFLIPCRILRPIAKSDSEAAIWIENTSKHPKLYRSVPPNVVNFASILGSHDIGFVECMDILSNFCASTLDKILRFHCDLESEINYHEMLHAVVRRHALTLDTIKVLVKIGRTEHALAVARMAYEAFLNFYLDWLSPQFFGPRLQFLSALRFNGTDNDPEIKNYWTILANFPALLENTSEKARVSPLGMLYHKMVYPPLSLVAHQSYGNLETQATFINRSEIKESLISPGQLAKWLDLLTAALLIRVENEIGNTLRPTDFEESTKYPTPRHPQTAPAPE